LNANPQVADSHCQPHWRPRSMVSMTDKGTFGHGLVGAKVTGASFFEL
jgi:hypothetical protein